MNFIHEQGYDVKVGKQLDFQHWLETNQEKIKLECPDGIEYEGTYAVVQTSEKNAGSFRTLWRMDSYGAMDKFAAAMKQPTTFARLLEEWGEFSDNRNEAHWSYTVLKDAVEASIWSDHE